MLIEFTVKNWGPFLSENRFSMEETRISSSSDLVEERLEAGWLRGVAPVAALFGANASGKSQFVMALKTLATSVRNGEVGLGDMNPFALGAEGSEPSVLEVVFVAPGTLRENTDYEYRYSLSVLDGAVQREALFYRLLGRSKERLVFERVHGAEAPGPGFRAIGSYWYRWSQELKGQKVLVAGSTEPQDLFLTHLGREEYGGLEPVLNFFRNSLRFYHAEAFQSEFDVVKQRLRERSSAYRDRLEKYLVRADLGISSVRVAKVSEDEQAALRRMFEEFIEHYGDLASRGGESDPDTIVERLVEEQAWGVHFVHHGADGQQFPLPLEKESRGTQAMLAFASVAIDVLDSGATMVVDELDSSLHPLQVRQLVKQFEGSETNPRQAQLIFTTHDVSLLLDSAVLPRVLERDQIWFSEKDTTGRSTMFSLSEFGPRKGEDILGRYLRGVYGAVPYPTSVVTEDPA